VVIVLWPGPALPADMTTVSPAKVEHLRRRGQQIVLVARQRGPAERHVDDLDVIGVAVREDPLHPGEDPRELGVPGRVDDPDADDVRVRRNTGPRAVRRRAIAGDESGNVRAVTARIAVRLLAGEVDPREDPSGEVRMVGHAAVDHRHRHPIALGTGRPGLRRVHREDPGFRRGRRGVRFVPGHLERLVPERCGRRAACARGR